MPNTVDYGALGTYELPDGITESEWQNLADKEYARRSQYAIEVRDRAQKTREDRQAVRDYAYGDVDLPPAPVVPIPTPIGVVPITVPDVSFAYGLVAGISRGTGQMLGMFPKMQLFASDFPVQTVDALFGDENLTDTVQLLTQPQRSAAYKGQQFLNPTLQNLNMPALTEPSIEESYQAGGVPRVIEHVGELASEQIPQLALGYGMGLAGKAIGLSPTVARYLIPTAMTFPLEAAGTMEEQIQRTGHYDPFATAAVGTVASAAEQLGGVPYLHMLEGGRLLPTKTALPMARQVAGKLFRTGLGEAAQETIQEATAMNLPTLIGDMPPIPWEEQVPRLVDSGVIGGVVGLGTGGLGYSAELYNRPYMYSQNARDRMELEVQRQRQHILDGMINQLRAEQANRRNLRYLNLLPAFIADQEREVSGYQLDPLLAQGATWGAPPVQISESGQGGITEPVSRARMAYNRVSPPVTLPTIGIQLEGELPGQREQAQERATGINQILAQTLPFQVRPDLQNVRLPLNPDFVNQPLFDDQGNPIMVRGVAPAGERTSPTPMSPERSALRQEVLGELEGRDALTAKMDQEWVAFQNEIQARVQKARQRAQEARAVLEKEKLSQEAKAERERILREREAESIRKAHEANLRRLQELLNRQERQHEEAQLRENEKGTPVDEPAWNYRHQLARAMLERMEREYRARYQQAPPAPVQQEIDFTKPAAKPQPAAPVTTTPPVATQPPPAKPAKQPSALRPKKPKLLKGQKPKAAKVTKTPVSTSVTVVEGPGVTPTPTPAATAPAVTPSLPVTTPVATTPTAPFSPPKLNKVEQAEADRLRREEEERIAARAAATPPTPPPVAPVTTPTNVSPPPAAPAKPGRKGKAKTPAPVTAATPATATAPVQPAAPAPVAKTVLLNREGPEAFRLSVDLNRAHNVVHGAAPDPSAIGGRTIPGSRALLFLNANSEAFRSLSEPVRDAIIRALDNPDKVAAMAAIDQILIRNQASPLLTTKEQLQKRKEAEELKAKLEAEAARLNKEIEDRKASFVPLTEEENAQIRADLEEEFKPPKKAKRDRSALSAEQRELGKELGNALRGKRYVPSRRQRTESGERFKVPSSVVFFMEDVNKWLEKETDSQRRAMVQAFIDFFTRTLPTRLEIVAGNDFNRKPVDTSKARELGQEVVTDTEGMPQKISDQMVGTYWEMILGRVQADFVAYLNRVFREAERVNPQNPTAVLPTAYALSRGEYEGDTKIHPFSVDLAYSRGKAYAFEKAKDKVENEEKAQARADKRAGKTPKEVTEEQLREQNRTANNLFKWVRLPAIKKRNPFYGAKSDIGVKVKSWMRNLMQTGMLTSQEITPHGDDPTFVPESFEDFQKRNLIVFYDFKKTMKQGDFSKGYLTMLWHLANDPKYEKRLTNPYDELSSFGKPLTPEQQKQKAKSGLSSEDIGRLRREFTAAFGDDLSIRFSLGEVVDNPVTMEDLNAVLNDIFGKWPANVNVARTGLPGVAQVTYTTRDGVTRQTITVDLMKSDSREDLKERVQEEILHTTYNKNSAEFKRALNMVTPELYRQMQNLYFDRIFTQSKAILAQTGLSGDKLTKAAYERTHEIVREEAAIRVLIAEAKKAKPASWARRFWDGIVSKFRNLFGLNITPLEAARIIERAVNRFQKTEQRWQDASDPFVMDAFEDEARRRMSYGGVNATNLPDIEASTLQTARQMVANGKSSEEIRTATGWFLGPADGKLRWEIPDQDMQVKFGWQSLVRFPGRVYLKHLIEHHDLFEAYPEMADIRITFFDENSLGSYTAPTSDNEESININPNQNSESVRKNVIHEIQHALQYREGFDRGASPLEDAVIKEARRRTEEKIDAMPKEYLDEYLKLNTERVNWQNAERKRTGEEWLARVRDMENRGWRFTFRSKDLEEALRIDEELVRNPNWKPAPGQNGAAYMNAVFKAVGSEVSRESPNEWPKLGDFMRMRSKVQVSPMEVYRDTAGEFEARDVEARIDFDDSQRAALGGVAPYSSEERPEQFYRRQHKNPPKYPSASSPSERVTEEVLQAAEDQGLTVRVTEPETDSKETVVLMGKDARRALLTHKGLSEALTKLRACLGG